MDNVSSSHGWLPAGLALGGTVMVLVAPAVACGLGAGVAEAVTVNVLGAAESPPLWVVHPAVPVTRATVARTINT
jgi:hypothetical protein